MIPLEVVFRLLGELRVENIDTMNAPQGRDGFAFGDICGALRTIKEIEIRLNNLVEESNRGEDRQ